MPINEGEKARRMRAAIASTADALPGVPVITKILATVADETPSIVLAALYDEIASQISYNYEPPVPQTKPPIDARHPLDIPRPSDQRPYGPLLARNKFFGSSCGTPYVSDGDTARVLFYMNLSGAYGGCPGHAQAMRDAAVFAAAYDLLDVAREWERYGMANGGEENYSFLADTRAAIKKAGG